MKQYKLVDNVLGWLAFFIAAFVYCSTIEPTASFWDCPEFITTGYKLEIGHPPGAPFFMLTANLFSQFASDVTQVAKMVNIMSALLSATTILFLFWTITHLTRKLIVKDWESMTLSKLIAIEGSGLVGALIYTFSDTFWFSAVEGEVYAYSSAFTAIVFWLILKWEDHADEPLFPLFAPAPTNQDGQESVSQPETVTGRRDGPERGRGIGSTGYDHWPTTRTLRPLRRTPAILFRAAGCVAFPPATVLLPPPHR